MNRRFVVKGDKTDRNALELDEIADSSFGGHPLAHVGAPVFRNSCGTACVILGDGLPRTMATVGKNIAQQNDVCRCKCEPLPKLAASQATGTLSA